LGAPINIKKGILQKNRKIYSNGKAAMKVEEFLSFYRDEIARLPKPGKHAASYTGSLNGEERSVFASLLPVAAALKQGHSEWGLEELLEATKAYCAFKIIRALP